MPKIAIVGTHGGGKTTLGRLLATHLSFDLITERVRQTAKALGYGTPRDVPDDDRPLFQWASLMSQVSAEDRNESFVSDRSTVDYAAYWTLLINPCRDDYQDYRTLARIFARRYDALILVPAPVRAEEDGARFTHMVHETDVTMRGLLEEWELHGKVIEVLTDGPENRLQEVIAALKERGIIDPFDGDPGNEFGASRLGVPLRTQPRPPAGYRE